MDALDHARSSSVHIVALCVLFAVSSTFADESNRQERFPNGIATVDVGRVFKECAVFRAEMKLLQAEVDSHKKQLEEHKAYLEHLQAAIEEQTDPLAKEPLKVEAATFKQDVAQETSQKKTLWLESEKELYADLIEVVIDEVSEFAAENQLSLVVRNNHSRLLRDTRKNVLDYVNRDILYRAPNMDITDEIVLRVNARLRPAETDDEE